jgi:putative FmdB family regulatory protein
MPIYEYKCQECGQCSEFRIVSESQVKTLACTGCGSRNLKKLMSVPVISSGRPEPKGQACCGQNEGCSQPGHCCGHQEN